MAARTWSRRLFSWPKAGGTKVAIQAAKHSATRGTFFVAIGPRRWLLPFRPDFIGARFSFFVGHRLVSGDANAPRNGLDDAKQLHPNRVIIPAGNCLGINLVNPSPACIRVDEDAGAVRIVFHRTI